MTTKTKTKTTDALDVDMQALLKELCRIKLWRSFFRERGIPAMEVTYRDDAGTTGLAHWGDHRVCVGVGNDCDLAELEETILHELAHLYNGSEPANHGIKWRRIIRAACLERWNVWSNRRIRQDLDLDLAARIREKLSVKNYKPKTR
jgi:hypothetical protein